MTSGVVLSAAAAVLRGHLATIGRGPVSAFPAEQP